MAEQNRVKLSHVALPFRVTVSDLSVFEMFYLVKYLGDLFYFIFHAISLFLKSQLLTVTT